MISKVDEIDYCKLQVSASIEKSIVDDKKFDIISKFRDLKVPGFRPGKATNAALKQHFKKEIAETLRQELAQQVYSDVIAEHSISPFGYPEFSKLNIDDNGFSCEFIVLKKPTIELAQYKGFDIPKFYHKVPAEELTQQMLQELRIKYGTNTVFNETDVIQETDNVILNYTAFNENGDEIPELKVDGGMLIAGKSDVPGFDDNLYGMKIGETKEFIIKAPEQSSFSNQNIKFVVNVLMGSKSVPAPLDDELAKTIGLTDLNHLKSLADGSVSAKMKQVEDQYYLDQVARRLVENHKIEVPTWISTFEAQYIAKSNKLDWNDLSDEQKLFYITSAEDNVRLSLVLDKVRDNEVNAQLSDEEVFNIVKENIQKSVKSQEELQQVFENLQKSGQIQMLFARARDEFCLTFIKNVSTIID